VPVQTSTAGRLASAPPVPAVPLAVVAGLFLASVALRPQLLAIGPLLPLIRADLDLSASVAGLLTTIPVLCMGIFAPIGPRVAARVGPATALAGCLVLIVGGGVARALVPGVPLLLLTTFGIGVAIGIAGAIPSMIVARRLPMRPALGTGAYAGGIVLGSTLASAVAVPLAVDGAWRSSLLVISLASVTALAAWLVLVVRGDRRAAVPSPPALRLPWGSATAWLLVLVFGLQSILYYGVIAWLPNVYVERGWDAAGAGALVALFNGIGLVTTIGVPLVADRLGRRRPQLVVASIAAFVGFVGIALLPDLALLWVPILGLALGMVFPLSLTLPVDVADDPAAVGSVAALMLLGGYVLSSVGPVALGAIRDLSGAFGLALWALAVLSAALVVCCLWLSPARLRTGVGRASAPG
jgi:CP family cyanate transporter-like MFS transporter